MKVAAILFMILGVFLIVGVGMMSLFGFAMSFDAPGSEHDPQAWLNRILIFALPLLVFIVILVLAWIAFSRGNYIRSFWIGSVFGLVVIGFALITVISSFMTIGQITATNLQTAREEKLYPIQKFLRPGEDGADTIIVFPSRIVAYRIYTGDQNRLGGPVGDLNKTRDTIILDFDTDTRIKREDLSQFVDAEGRRLTDVYGLK
ncbi:MAG: hypothetical protein ABJB16_10460 [Saprospiraceae bacterium]